MLCKHDKASKLSEIAFARELHLGVKASTIRLESVHTYGSLGGYGTSFTNNTSNLF